MRKGYTTAIRMGAGYNNMTVFAPGSAPERVELPPPVEPYHGRKPEVAHSQKHRQHRINKRDAILSKLGRELCEAYGIVGKRKRREQAIGMSGYVSKAQRSEELLAA